jgi:hypothetical protein
VVLAAFKTWTVNYAEKLSIADEKKTYKRSDKIIFKLEKKLIEAHLSKNQLVVRE